MSLDFKKMLEFDKKYGKLSMTCPFCGSMNWTSVKKEDGINMIIRCMDCNKERKRPKNV